MPKSDQPPPFASLNAVIQRLEELGRTPSDEAAGLTELDHGLQCAHQLRLVAPDDVGLQVAGLVHDIAHGLSVIDAHDRHGEAAVIDVLGPRIARLVGLHVAAKRYLVAIDPAYRARQSPVSVDTLALQGGEMSADEVRAFEAEPHAAAAVNLRRADEAAKVPGRDVPGLDAWLPALRAAAMERA